MSLVLQSREGVTPRQAALIAGIGVLLGLGVPWAEFVVGPLLFVPGNIEATIGNLAANRGLFVASIFAYFIAFAADVVVAWALYVLFAPVNRALAMLAAWIRLVFAIIGLGALMNLVTAFRIVTVCPSDHRLGARDRRLGLCLLLPPALLVSRSAAPVPDPHRHRFG